MNTHTRILQSHDEASGPLSLLSLVQQLPCQRLTSLAVCQLGVLRVAALPCEASRPWWNLYPILPNDSLRTRAAVLGRGADAHEHGGARLRLPAPPPYRRARRPRGPDPPLTRVAGTAAAFSGWARAADPRSPSLARSSGWPGRDQQRSAVSTVYRTLGPKYRDTRTGRSSCESSHTKNLKTSPITIRQDERRRAAGYNANCTDLGLKIAKPKILRQTTITTHQNKGEQQVTMSGKQSLIDWRNSTNDSTGWRNSVFTCSSLSLSGIEAAVIMTINDPETK